MWPVFGAISNRAALSAIHDRRTAHHLLSVAFNTADKKLRQIQFIIEGLDMDGDACPCGAQTATQRHTDATEALARQRPPLHNTGAL